MKAAERERGAERALEEGAGAGRRRSRAATTPRMIELRQVGGLSLRRAGCLRRAGLRFRLLAGARSGAALGVDAPALGPLVLLAALLLGLGHGSNLIGRGLATTAARSCAWRGRSHGSARPPGSRRGRPRAAGRPARPRAAGRRAARRARGRARRRVASGVATRVVDVGRDLAAAAGELEADRPHAGQAAARLAQAGGDGAGDLDVAAVELDVEGGERRAGRDEGGPRASGAGSAGPRSGAQLAALHPQTRARPGRRCGSRRARGAPGELASSP